MTRINEFYLHVFIVLNTFRKLITLYCCVKSFYFPLIKSSPMI
ncbi:hypothetical protein A1OE_193 [Candidatus Endolissoclinum faulkneri L2]|uniref:Uncharacterized protein n=1 Tax=Candidatus Endolissoclinum faulkneri L2 TaxID=1193729 RepID=K7YFN2_9PROT|nr:hypothetical protein A1OE_193 [Candidatus Endolissoclinum faulkneri L2]